MQYCIGCILEITYGVSQLVCISSSLYSDTYYFAHYRVGYVVYYLFQAFSTDDIDSGEGRTAGFESEEPRCDSSNLSLDQSKKSVYEEEVHISL